MSIMSILATFTSAPATRVYVLVDGTHADETCAGSS
jgi:hypothetical protein